MTRKTSKQLKLLAFIMSLMMLLTVAPLSAFAQDEVAIDAGTSDIEAIDEVISDEETPADAEPEATPGTATLTAADVPEFIALTDLTTRGTIRRLYEEEADLSTILFENNDGTRTLYMYGVPVKYVAPDGTTRDKSTAISTLSGLQTLWNGTTLTPDAATALAQSASIGRLDLDTAADALTLMSTRLSAAYGSDLTLSDMAYATLDSDIRSLYPIAAIDGIVLNYGDYSIRTIPAGGNQIVLGNEASIVETTSLTDNDTRTRVRYNGAFGVGTVLQYTPTTMGVKEEIILTSNVGKNAFSFLIETDGLTIVEENGSYYFFAPETQTTVARLGEVIAYDSNGQIARGATEVVTIREGQQYGVTISVSEEFLADAVYPVSVDPSVTIEPDDYADPSLSLDNSGQKAMEYVSVYHDTSGWGYTFDIVLNIGLNSQYYDNSTGTGVMFGGRALYRFPLFYNQYSPYHDLISAQIQSFTLNLPTATTTNNTMSVTAYPATSKSWSPGVRICDFTLYYGYDTTYYDRGSRNANSGIISIDMTELAKLWCDWESDFTDYTYGDPEYGVLLMPTWDYGDHCTVYADEVYVTLDYSETGTMGNYYLNNRSNSGFLHSANDTVTTQHGLLENLGIANMTWEFEYLGNNQYAIHPNGGDVVYLACDDDDGHPYILSRSIGIGGYDEAKWTITPAPGGGIQLTTVSGYTLGINSTGALVGAAASSFTDPKQRAWRLLPTDSYTELSYIDIYIGGELYDYSDSGQCLVVDYNGTASATIDYGNANLVSTTDFKFSLAPRLDCEGIGSLGAIIRGNQITVAGLIAGSIDVIITHKPTRISVTLYVDVVPCGEQWPSLIGTESFYEAHSYTHLAPDGDNMIVCDVCHLGISADKYNQAYSQTQTDPSASIYTYYSSADAGVMFNAEDLLTYSLQRNEPFSDEIGVEAGAGIFRTESGQYVISRIYTDYLHDQITAYGAEGLTGYPEGAVLVGHIHTHPASGNITIFSGEDIAVFHNWSVENSNYAYGYVIQPRSTDFSRYEIWRVNAAAGSIEAVRNSMTMIYSTDE